MQFSRKNSLIISVVLLLLLALIAVFLGTETKKPVTEILSENEHSFKITKEDKRIEPEKPEMLALDELMEEQSGSQECEIVIADGGDYVLSGSAEGTIRIQAEDENVHLFLNGVTLKSAKGPAIAADSAGKLIITVMDGTENRISDGGAYLNDETADACIFSVCDLTINGTGKLAVSSFYEDALHTKDKLKVLNTELTVLGKKDGLHVNDGTLIQDAKVEIQAEENGIRSTKTGKKGKGMLEIRDSELSVIGGSYALNSAADIVLQGGSRFLKGVLGETFAGGTIYLDGEAAANE